VSGITDRDAAARYGVSPPREHDHFPTGNRTFKVDPRLDMDGGRFEADGWGRCEGWAFAPHDTGTPSKFRWWHRCRGCNTLLEASSREALERKFRAHVEAS
jgi:hypothetical protein